MDPISSVSSFIERYSALFTKEVPLAKRALQILKSGVKGFKIDITSGDGAKGDEANKGEWVIRL